MFKRIIPTLVVCLVLCIPVLSGQVTLSGTGAIGTANEGTSVALSSDGTTALVGGPGDNNGAGAAWVFTLSNGVWTQQGNKLVGTGAMGAAGQGVRVALSGDGNTALIGGPGDNSGVGALWVFTRSNGVWTQQGNKLVGTGATGAAGQGGSVSLSWDGNTAIEGGAADNSNAGAVWTFSRNGGVWTQQGNKLVGTGATGAAGQGVSVAMSWDGNTAIEGGSTDNGNTGAEWVFTRTNGVWTQQGGKLVGTGGNSTSRQGFSVALSADGNTAVAGGNLVVLPGGVWAFTRTGGTWTQQGGPLPLPGLANGQGLSVALSADGNTAITSGVGVPNFSPQILRYTRTTSGWVFGGELGNRGETVALSASGSTLLVGSFFDNMMIGDALVSGAPMYPSAGNPQSIPIGTASTIPLEVTIQDIDGNYLSGQTVTFSAPPAFATLSSPSAVTDSSGRASVQVTATSLAGSYNISAGDTIFTVSNVNTNAATGACKVTSDIDDNGPGTLRYQVAACGLGGIITFDPSISKVTLGQQQDIQLPQDLTIDGTLPAGGPVTIDANHQSRAFFVTGGSITLSNLTIENGFAKGGNGGSGNAAGGGAAGMGGAIFITGPNRVNTPFASSFLEVRVTNVTFTGNQAQGGNGGAFDSSSLFGGGGGVEGDGGNGTASQHGNSGGGGDFGTSGADFDRAGNGGASSFAGGASGQGFAGFGGGGSKGSGEAGTHGYGTFGGPGANSGGGGAGLGGAIYVDAGTLVLNGATFTANSAAKGTAGGSDSKDGQGKGGALFIGARAIYGSSLPSFTSNSATDAAINTQCSVLAAGAFDDANVCGNLLQDEAPIPDDFFAGIVGSQWTIVDPSHDGNVTLQSNDLALVVPGGSNHDPVIGGSDNSLHLLQALALPNADFQVEAKFDSIPSVANQSEGIIVQQDAADYLLFQFESNGSSLLLDGSKILSHVENVQFSPAISLPAGTGSLWLRVQKASNTWTVTWSADGSTYHAGGLFTQALAANNIGLFAGNSNSNPANAPGFTALIDYFHNGSAPVVQAPVTDEFNSPVLNTQLWKFANPVGDGSYALNGTELSLTVPAGANHDPDFGNADNAVRIVQSISNTDFQVEVKFDSIPHLQYQFEGILVEEDRTDYLRFQLGSTGRSLVVSADAVLNATEFHQFSSNISAPAGTTSLWLRVNRSGDTWTVSWSADGSVYQKAGVFSTAVIGVGALAGHALEASDVGVFAGNYNITPANAPAFTAVIDYFHNLPVTGPAGPPVADDFNSPTLNTTRWNFLNPVGDGSFVLNGSELLLTAPGGSNHDPDLGGVDSSVRVMQAISDQDFSITTKFDSIPTKGYQFEGIIVEQDPSDYLRFQLGSNGSSLIASGDVTIARTEAHEFSTDIQIPAGTTSLWLRVSRAGQNWTVSWSSDGTQYQTVGDFGQTLIVQGVGPFVGNYSNKPHGAPAFTAAVDFFAVP